MKITPCAIWQGVGNITDYKQNNSHPTSTDHSLSDQLNTIFARFEDSSSSNREPDPDTSFPESEQPLAL